MFIIPVQIVALDLRNFDFKNSAGTDGAECESHAKAVRCLVSQININ